MTPEAPTRCCAPATSGRCSNAPAPHGQSRYIGSVEIAACNQPKHQAALRSLPGFTRRDGVCGADGCGKPIPLGLCPDHRHLYQRHGVSIRALLATEPTMSAPTTAPAPGAQPPADDAEPSAGDVAEAVAAGVEAATVDSPFPGRWGQQHSALPEGPTAPGPTPADWQARAELLGEDAATQRERAAKAEHRAHDAQEAADRYEWLLDDMTQSRDAAIHELHEVGHALYLLGSDPAATAYEALCQILPPDRLVDLRRVEEALAAAEVARVRCRRGSAEALADAIAAHASAVHRLTEAEKAAPSLPPSATPLADDLRDLVARIRCDLQPMRGGQDVTILEGIYDDLRSVADRLARVEARP